MTVNTVAKAVIEAEAPVYYTDTGTTSKSPTTVSGSEFWIEDELSDGVAGMLGNPDVAYAFKLADCTAIVARENVIHLEKFFRGSNLP